MIIMSRGLNRWRRIQEEIAEKLSSLSKLLGLDWKMAEETLKTFKGEKM